MTTNITHTCSVAVAAVERLIAQKDEIAPKALSQAASQLDANIWSCPLCVAELRNRRPRAFAAVEATAAARATAKVVAANHLRFEELNELARQQASTRRVRFNTEPGEESSAITEEKRGNVDSDWLVGKGAGFPTLRRSS